MKKRNWNVKKCINAGYFKVSDVPEGHSVSVSLECEDNRPDGRRISVCDGKETIFGSLFYDIRKTGEGINLFKNKSF
jgi:hypothetical protein